MNRNAIDAMLYALEAAYRSDGFHALRVNLQDLRPGEWDTKPANATVEAFGEDPELSIADIVRHVGGAKLVYASNAFGDRSLGWGGVALPPPDREGMLAWLDAAHDAFAAAVAALPDDGELLVDRHSPAGRLVSTRRLITIITNHDLYHAGEINRQRSLMRGADGWERRP